MLNKISFFKNRITFLFLLFSLSSFSLFSQTSDFQNNQSLFIKGDISSKIIAVKTSCEAGDYSLALDALDFVISSSEILGNDQDLLLLAETAVNCIPENIEKEKSDQISERLIKIFNSFLRARFQFL